MPVFEGILRPGNIPLIEINGKFVKKKMRQGFAFNGRSMGLKERFKRADYHLQIFRGNWEVEFKPIMEKSYMAKGIFSQVDDKDLRYF